MKKIISFMLIIALIACLCGCKSKADEKTPDITNDPSSSLETEEAEPTEIVVETTDTTEVVEPESSDETEDTVPTLSDEPEYFTNEHGTYRRVDERVRTEGNVFLRSYPNGKKVVSVNVDVALTRVGIGEENGWSIVLYKDEEAYVPTYYLSPLESTHYEEVDEIVYTTQEVNFRAGPSIRSQNLGKFLKNSALTRIGIGEDGWSKIQYKEKVVYVYSLYLEKRDDDSDAEIVVNEATPVDGTLNENENVDPVETEPQDEVPISELTHYEQDGIIYEVVDETVEAARTVNVRSGPSTTSEKIGDLAGGKTIKRIAIGDNGWSKVIFKGKEAYIYSKYLLKR